MSKISLKKINTKKLAAITACALITGTAIGVVIHDLVIENINNIDDALWNSYEREIQYNQSISEDSINSVKNNINDQQLENDIENYENGTITNETIFNENYDPISDPNFGNDEYSR